MTLRPSHGELPGPGCAPRSGACGLDEDLARRDFTVNAIAVSLPDGQMASHPQAVDDLKAGVLRVLHPGSFTDDPTRIWRMARYAGRLGFEPDPDTAALAAVAGVGETSGETIGAELRLVLCEEDPCSAFEALARYSPQALPEGFVARPARLEGALDLLPADGRRDLTVLAACSAGIDVERLREWLEELAFTAQDRDVVLAASRWVTGEPLRAAESRAGVARAARAAPVEAVALAGGENAALWLNELRDIRLEITGDDLIAAGVPLGPRSARRWSAHWKPSSTVAVRAGKKSSPSRWGRTEGHVAARADGRIERSGEGLAVCVPGAGACFFTSLPAGDFTDPLPARLKALAGSLGIEGRRFSRSPQVHGSSVRLIAEPLQVDDEGDHDGQVTTSREVICAVRTADCLPVALLCADAVGMVHAGWRGLASGVIAQG